MDDSLDPLASSLADCLACLHDPAADPQARADWRAWLDASPERQRRYDELLRFWTVLPAAEERRRGRALLGRNAGFGATTSAAHRPWMGIAAVLLLLAVAGWWRDDIWQAAPTELHFAASQGEQRNVELPDGSKVVLDADSQLVVQFERRQRVVQLVRGQALFDVAHDTSRPFLVRARGGEIRAVGTEFDVQLTDSGVDVTLLQGAVLVAPPYASSKEDAGAHAKRGEPRRVARLAPGQQVSYRDEIGAIRTVDPSIAVTWREGRPSYLDRPLGAVVNDLRRYVGQTIRFADASVADIHYTGTISVRDLQSWTRALELAFPVRATVADDGAIVLSARRDGI